jgi:hypothetical protein
MKAMLDPMARMRRTLIRVTENVARTRPAASNPRISVTDAPPTVARDPEPGTTFWNWIAAKQHVA